MSEFADQRVTVMGLGRFGGGLSVTRWLAARGAKVLVTDIADETSLAQSVAKLADLIDAGRVRLRLGGHDERDFTDTDVVVANPAVPRPWENRCLLAARRARVPVTTEIRLVIERLHRERVIGVTGSAGKSTTAAMIHHILARLGRPAHLGGNIGGSLLEVLDAVQNDDWIVLELSSFMLYWLGADDEPGGSEPPFRAGPSWSPHIAVITNIEPNHLDWHGSIEHYEHCKRQIWAAQEPGDHAIGPVDVSGCAPGSPEGPPLAPLGPAVPGAHNQVNATLAVRACEAAGMDPDRARAALADFHGLPHRLELIAERPPGGDGQRFYNDSKSTTPQATLRAVAAFDDPSRVHLIVGGYDKGIDLRPVGELAVSVAGLYTIGATGGAIVEHAGRRRPNVHLCCTLERAVASAMTHMGAHDILLLSPGCASWDQFDNFEQRGRAFTDLVRDTLGSLSNESR